MSATVTEANTATENGSAIVLPRTNLFRGIMLGEPVEEAGAATERTIPLEVREEGSMPVLFGHFTRFNEWTEIDSFWEGRFMERMAPGAFTKTFQEQLKLLRCLFQHGRDHQVGSKPLGPIRQLEEQRQGPYYEVDLLDAEYVRELLPGLEAGVYGASFRMQVMREEIVKEPGVSKHNPEGIPERTIKEVRLFEFGPVTFPAYANATAGVRSLTDWYLDGGVSDFAHQDPERFRNFLFRQLEADPNRLRELVARDGDPSRAAEAAQVVTKKEGRATATADTSKKDSKSDAGGDPPSTSPSVTETKRSSTLQGRGRPAWKLGH